jgi:hypothetical protein
MPARGHGGTLRLVAGARIAVSLAALGAATLVLGAGPPRGAVPPTRVTVYLVRGERVAPVRRVVPSTRRVALAALTALVRGPTRAERAAGYTTCVPAGTRVRGVTISNRVATVDLGGRFESGGGSLSMLLRVAQVVHTATQFSSVERVSFRLDGRPVGAIGGEGVVVAPPVGRRAFEGQAPPILVEQPLPGDRVGRVVVVRGTANVFEARLLVDVRAPDGRLLVRRPVLASAGTGVRGTFETRVVVAPGARRLTIVAYARSPKDGSPVAVVRVPVAR